MVGSVPTIPHTASPVAATKNDWRAVAVNVLALAGAMWRVRRERRVLMSLDSRMLKDIGLNAGDVERETSRPLWDLPRSRDRY